ncbi:hypothetical protein QFZ70_000647 [Arthrobacter sp. V1I9]|nr:hypothetical protein [Arthrobacter sp. V1I9]
MGAPACGLRAGGSPGAKARDCPGQDVPAARGSQPAVAGGHFPELRFLRRVPAGGPRDEALAAHHSLELVGDLGNIRRQIIHLALQQDSGLLGVRREDQPPLPRLQLVRHLYQAAQGIGIKYDGGTTVCLPVARA